LVDNSLLLQVELQPHLKKEKDADTPFVVSSNEVVYCKGFIRQRADEVPSELKIDESKQACTQELNIDDCYAPLQVGRFLIGPCTGDAYYLPFNAEAFDIYHTPGETAYVHVSLIQGCAPDKFVKANVLLCDAAGVVQVAIKNVSYVKSNILSEYAIRPSSTRSVANNDPLRSSGPVQSSAHEREQCETSDESINEYVITVFTEKLAELLRIDSRHIDIDEAFSDYGVDSIMGTKLMTPWRAFC